MKSLNGFLLLIFISFFFFLINCEIHSNTISYKCGINLDTDEPQELSETEEQEITNDRRMLNSDDFKEFNIFFDLVNFQKEIDDNGIDQGKKEFFKNGIETAITILKKLLKVKPVKNYKFTAKQLQTCIEHYDTSKIGNSQGMVDAQVDLFIFVKFKNHQDIGNNHLASAKICFVDSITKQPLMGIITINKNIDYSKTNSLQYFESIILHELIHILGFSKYHFTNVLTKITKNNAYNEETTYIASEKVLSQSKIYFSCDSIQGIELEKYGNNGDFGSHWSERILLGDIMTEAIYPEEQVISEFTLALLEDTGYYKANYYTGGLMQFGKHKGCEFLDEKCLVETQLKFKNEFFINIPQNGFDPGCSSGRQSRAYHAIYTYNSIPDKFKYFSEGNLGGRESADYCPVSQEDSVESKDDYYFGHCSTKGSSNYGSKVPYIDVIDDTNINLSSITREKFSENSFCVLSSLISKQIENYQTYSQKIHAICYQMHCSKKSLTIQINNDYIVCPRAGGKITVLNYEGYLFCPDYYLICSGTELCNNMFDCVEKESSLKNNIEYDYTIRTSQDINSDEDYTNEAYELDTEGKCPQFCSQCDEDCECIKCGNEYGIVYNEQDKKICKPQSELSCGYYKENEIYYKCLEHCSKCADNTTCEECNSEYAFENDNHYICYPKSMFANSNYYTKDNGKSYYNCNYITNGIKGIENCNECIYQNSELLCKKCTNGYIVVNGDMKECKSKANYIAEYYEDPNDSNNYLSCSDLVKNCASCTYEGCTSCKKR